ncbi:MAG: NUDIX hydrolase [Candidatus Omnitrophica bacterium]|nr:NUDIX hydrolase [Candidatus Omnitrophota bacterium]
MYKTKQEISAGAVVFNFIKQLPMIVIYSRKNATEWCLPKGKLESGETSEQAAIREVAEETGVKAIIIEHIKDIYYKYTDPKRQLELDKTVRFFLMKKLATVSREYDREVDAVEWLPIDKALEKLSFESERGVVEKALQLIRKQGYE